MAKKILLTGGAGYVGSLLTPKLLEEGYHVTVIDLFIYGDDVLDACKDHTNLKIFKGDIRNRSLLLDALTNCDTVIHLACISNDPSFELNPQLGKSINYDASIELINLSKKMGIKSFIYASSSSVYGIKHCKNVTEDLLLEPLTDYSKYKAKVETYLLEEASNDFSVTIIRPATVCGYSPRLRLDLTVNILTNHAINKGHITVFGGSQMRPNINIKDMVELYSFILRQPKEKIYKKIYNVGYENFTVKELADQVNETLGGNIPIKIEPTDDLRSYHISSEKIRRELGFSPKYSLKEAVLSLKDAFMAGLIPEPMTNSRYYNIKRMQELKLT